MVQKTPLFFGLVLAQSHSQIDGTRSRSSPTCSCWFLIFVWLQGTLLRFRDRALVASAETLIPHRESADAPTLNTFFLARCAAFSRARNRRRIRFPWPAFPVLPQSPFPSAATVAVPARRIRCPARITPSPR